jgi:hypothetical protein
VPSYFSVFYEVHNLLGHVQHCPCSSTRPSFYCNTLSFTGCCIIYNLFNRESKNTVKVRSKKSLIPREESIYPHLMIFTQSVVDALTNEHFQWSVTKKKVGKLIRKIFSIFRQILKLPPN